MTEAAILLAVATLAAGIALAFAIRLLPRLRLQLAGLALLAVVLPLVAVLASGWVMFHMEDDAKILSVAAASALSAVGAALLLARWILGPLDRLRGASAELAAGDLTARAPTSGPIEIAELGESFNEMATSIEQLFDARRQLTSPSSSRRPPSTASWPPACRASPPRRAPARSGCTPISTSPSRTCAARRTRSSVSSSTS